MFHCLDLSGFGCLDVIVAAPRPHVYTRPANKVVPIPVRTRFRFRTGRLYIGWYIAFRVCCYSLANTDGFFLCRPYYSLSRVAAADVSFVFLHEVFA